MEETRLGELAGMLFLQVVVTSTSNSCIVLVGPAVVEAGARHFVNRPMLFHGQFDVMRNTEMTDDGRRLDRLRADRQ